MSPPQNFREALICVYRENPCEVLPNALWKSLPWAGQFETDFIVEGDLVTQLKAWNPTHLMMYWKRDRGLPGPNSSILSDSLIFALLHKDFEASIRLEDFSQRQSYFRFIHKMGAIPEAELPSGYKFAVADPVGEAQEISDLIGACYEDIHPSPADVRGWCEHPVFDDELWVWITDEVSETPVGLGIAEFDPMIAEGSLEWIQVLPEIQGRGLGKQIVFELLHRLKGRAAFVTVSGKMKNQTRPDKLYQSCGFEGKNIWWVLHK